MIIDCISDLHGFPPPLPGGDLLIVAGDLTARDTASEYLKFFSWLMQQSYKKIILIAGNHDGEIEKGFVEVKFYQGSRIVYLEDSYTEYEGLKIWGSPWTPTFGSWHFMQDRGAPIKEKWDLIPDDTDILITHGPAYGILDQVKESSRKKGEDRFAGCKELRNAIFRVKPKLHVFGHIHEMGCKKVNLTTTTFVNACIMDEKYRPIHSAVRVIL